MGFGSALGAMFAPNKPHVELPRPALPKSVRFKEPKASHDFTPAQLIDANSYRGFGLIKGPDKRWHIDSLDLDPGGKGYDSPGAARRQIDLFWPHRTERLAA